MVESKKQDKEAESQVVAEEGKKFEEARESSGLTRAEVAYRLNLTETYITCIEQEQFDQLPGPIFVRGYVSNYARLLEINGDGLIAQYNAYLEGLEPQKKNIIRINQQVKPSDPVVKWATFIILLLVFALSMLWWNMRDEVAAPQLPPSSLDTGQEIVLAEHEPATVVLEADAVSENTAGRILDNPVLENRSIENTGSVDPSENLAVPENDPTLILNSDQQQLDASNQLQAEFIGESWMEVKGGNRQVLFTGVKKAGAVIRLESEDSFDIVIGNAAAVNLSYNGVPVDLARFTNRRNVAVLNLAAP